MEQLIKENNLLKGYIATLQQQNQSRNRERKILTEQLDRLSAQFDKATSKGSSSSIPAQQTKHFQQQINKLLQQKQSLINHFNNDITILTQQSKNYQSQVKSLLLQIGRIKSNNQNSQLVITSIKKLEEQKNNSQKIINDVICQNNTLKENLKFKQEKQQSLISQLSKLDKDNNNNNNLQQQFRNKQQHYESIIAQLQLEVQNNNTQLGRLREIVASANETVSGKYKTELQIKQLRNQLDDLKYEYGKIQREKLVLQNKIRQLQNQSIEKTSKLLRLQKQQSLQETYQTNINIKEKQIKTLITLNQNLKEELAQTQQIIRTKDQTIFTLQKNIEDIDNSQNQQIQQYKNLLHSKNQQLNSLKQQFHQKISMVTAQLQSHRNRQRNNQYQVMTQAQNLFDTVRHLQAERDVLKDQSDNYKSIINNLRKQNNALKESVDLQYKNIQQLGSLQQQQKQIKSQIQFNQKIDSNFLQLINELKLELNQVKVSNKKTAEQNSKLQMMVQKYMQQQNPPNNNFYENYDQYSAKIEDLSMGQQFMGRKLKLRKQYPQLEQSWMKKQHKYQIPIAPASINTYQPTQNDVRINSEAYKNINYDFSIKQSKNQFNIKSETKNQKMTVNRQKWQNLQRKINSLRQQNQELKKTLFQ